MPTLVWVNSVGRGRQALIKLQQKYIELQIIRAKEEASRLLGGGALVPWRQSGQGEHPRKGRGLARNLKDGKRSPLTSWRERVPSPGNRSIDWP